MHISVHRGSEKKEHPHTGSYTSQLFEEGEEKKKVGEEMIEVLIADGRNHTIYESADLRYHFLVLLRSYDIEVGDIMKELRRRRT